VNRVDRQWKLASVKRLAGLGWCTGVVSINQSINQPGRDYVLYRCCIK